MLKLHDLMCVRVYGFEKFFSKCHVQWAEIIVIYITSERTTTFLAFSLLLYIAHQFQMQTNFENYPSCEYFPYFESIDIRLERKGLECSKIVLSASYGQG